LDELGVFIGEKVTFMKQKSVPLPSAGFGGMQFLQVVFSFKLEKEISSTKKYDMEIQMEQNRSL
jgi:hypothetical protein